MASNPDVAGQRWFGGVRHSAERRCLIRRDGTEVVLRAQSLAVFRYLSERSDTVVSKEALRAAIWPNVVVTDDSLVQCMADIRRVLGDEYRHVLRTIPRQGYLMSADAEPPAARFDSAIPPEMPPSSAADAAAGVPRPSPASADQHGRVTAPAALARGRRMPWFGAGAVLLLGAVVGVAFLRTGTEPAAPVVSATAAHAPTVSLQLVRPAEPTPGRKVLDAVAAESRIMLGRYPTVRLADGADTDYRLVIGEVPGVTPTRLTVEVHAVSERRVIFAETYDVAEGRDGIRHAAAAIAVFASPGGGALSRHLMSRARHKPVETLSRAECYAHGYDCSACSGELETITTRALACLDSILEKDPNDATAWGLKASAHAVQWRFGFSLAEPERSDLLLRARRIDMAVDAANRAEALSDGNNSAVYWGMVQAYFVKCDVDRMRTAVQRGLAINPYDPALLAVFGNWMINAGQLDEGKELIERALTIEPRRFPSWWLFGLGNRHYYRGEYEQAHAIWLRAFNDRNWISANHLAYTLPLIGRLDEARESVRKTLALYPGFTIEKALQFYKSSCFDDQYLATMQSALQQAGLPSRMPSPSPQRLDVPPVRVKTVNGYPVEYLDLGSGEPIVFLHGAIADYRAWGDLELPISARQRFISYSQRCFGSQPGTCKDPPQSYQTYVDDLAAFVEALELGPVHLVGWSSGARLAGTLAAMRPELVKSTVLFEPVEEALNARGDAAWEEAKRRKDARFQPILDALKVDDAYAASARFLEFAWEMDTGDFEKERVATRRVISENMVPGTTKFMAVYGTEPRFTCELLGRFRAPTLVVHGERTEQYWQSMSRRAADCIPGARLAAIGGVKHDAPMRKPNELAEMILQFVEENTKPKRVAASAATN